MSDFKFDNYEEQTPELLEKKRSKGFKNGLIITLIVCLVVGLGTYLLCTVIFGAKEKEKQNKGEEIPITNESVKILYDNVTYGVRGSRNDKFLKEKTVTINSFSNYEKFYYALQYSLPGDLYNTNQKDTAGNTIYRLPTTKIDEYMKEFFGPNVTYTFENSLSYTFLYSVEGKNVGRMTYNQLNNAYDIIFDSFQDNVKNDNLVNDYYTKLYKAYVLEDNTLQIDEKVIFTTLTHNTNYNGDYYSLAIYKDNAHTNLIEQKGNMTIDEIKSLNLSVDYYINKAATVSYYFKVSGNSYYFDHSTIS